MSIRHVVSWQLTADQPAEKAAHAEQIATGLRGLVGVVPDIRSLQAGTDAVGGGNWDVVMIADFADREALARYQAHPEHQKVAGFIGSVVAARSCVDFEVVDFEVVDFRPDPRSQGSSRVGPRNR